MNSGADLFADDFDLQGRVPSVLSTQHLQHTFCTNKQNNHKQPIGIVLSRRTPIYQIGERVGVIGTGSLDIIQDCGGSRKFLTRMGINLILNSSRRTYAPIPLITLK